MIRLLQAMKWGWVPLLILGMGGMSPAQATSYATSCTYFFEDFSGLSANSWDTGSDGTWTDQNEALRVSGIASGRFAAASTAFRPPDYFYVDVDASGVSTSTDSDAFGLYAWIGAGDVFFSVDGHAVDGVAVLYYPRTGKMRFMVWNFEVGEWNYSNFHDVSGPVTSVGLKYTEDAVVFRANHQDTALALRGSFLLAGTLISDLWLMAAGTGLAVTFDNVCAGPLSEAAGPPPAGGMPLPVGGVQIASYAPVAAPVVSENPAAAQPLGLGTAASGGDTLSLRAGLAALAAAGDLYVAIQLNDLAPNELFFVTQSGGLVAYSSAGAVKWRANSSGNLNEQCLPDIPTSLLPPGSYTFWFLLTPAGRLDAMQAWYTTISLAGSGPAVTDPALEQEVRGILDLLLGSGGLGMITGLGSGESSVLTDIAAVFNTEGGYVTMTPAKIEFPNIPSQVILDLNFGSGYRAGDGTVMRGSGRVTVSNIQFGNTGLGADFSLTANNITRDGATIVDGSLSGGLSMTGTNQQSSINGNLQFSNLNVQGTMVNGGISISGDMALNVSDPTASGIGAITITPNNLRIGDYTLSSGNVVITQPGEDLVQFAFDLSTNMGPVDITFRLSQGAGEALVLNSTARGTVGPYALEVKNLTTNPAVCAEYPSAGTIVFSRSGSTAEVRFTGACDGSYQYVQTR